MTNNFEKNMSRFYIQINEKGGKYFRKYTEDTLQMLYDISPTAANFELMVLIEGLVFMALRVHFIVIGKKNDYEKFIEKDDRLNCAIDKLASEEIIDKVLEGQLIDYRKMRNEIAHNAFRIKSFKSKLFPLFKDYSYSEAFKDLFNKGMKIFRGFSKFIVPGRPSQGEFIKRFKGKYHGKKIKFFL